MPCRQEVAEEAHRNPAEAEARQLTRRRVQVRRLCFCAVVKVAVVEAHPAAVEPHLQQVREGQEPRSQRTSDRSAERSQLRLRIVH